MIRAPLKLTMKGSIALRVCGWAIMRSPLRQRASQNMFKRGSKVTVKNSSINTVKSIDWDYVFLDRATETELGRREFTSDEKVSPGKSKELTVVISKPPTQTISLTALNSSEREAMIERVTVVRIEYTDGTAWQRP